MLQGIGISPGIIFGKARTMIKDKISNDKKQSQQQSDNWDFSFEEDGKNS